MIRMTVEWESDPKAIGFIVDIADEDIDLPYEEIARRYLKNQWEHFQLEVKQA